MWIIARLRHRLGRIIDNVLVSVGVGQHKGSLDAGASKKKKKKTCLPHAWGLISFVVRLLAGALLDVTSRMFCCCRAWESLAQTTNFAPYRIHISLTFSDFFFFFFARQRLLDTLACWSWEMYVKSDEGRKDVNGEAEAESVSEREKLWE